MDPGKGVEESENIQQPQNYPDDNHGVQDGLDRSLHWYEAIDQPEENPYYHQNYHDLK